MLRGATTCSIFSTNYLFVPISFHPAAALLRRRVKQTRELCCDELVAERILNAEVYARSLVRLAGSAPPLRRLSVTTTVGIADADILEARIMSLLKKTRVEYTLEEVVAGSCCIIDCRAVCCCHSFRNALRRRDKRAGSRNAGEGAQRERSPRDEDASRDEMERLK